MRYRMRSRSLAWSAVLAMTVAATLAGVTQATSTSAKATGTYAYTSSSGPKSVSIAAHATAPVKGRWTLTNLNTGAVRDGVVTCLVVDGADAWIAGSPTSGEFGAFFYLHDGGEPGTDDLAVTFVQDPGQPFEELQNWCETRYTGIGQYPLDSGNLVVHASS